MNEPHRSLPVAPSSVVTEIDGSLVEYTEVPIALEQLEVAHNRVLRKEQLADLSLDKRGTLLSLAFELFVTHWREVVFGTCIQGSVFELQMSAEPTQFSYLDGYLTVYLAPGPSHLHLCLGPHRGLKSETSSELARVRQCSRAAFARTLGDDGQPHNWSIMLFNGAGEQMISFFLPSPFLDLAREKYLREPAWEHLSLWNSLRARYLGERTPQPLPRPRGRGTCA